MRYVICSLLLCFTTGVASAQHALKISTNTRVAPAFRLNHTTHSNAFSSGLKLSVYSFDKAPVELGLYYTRGYDSSVAFSYGVMLAFIFDVYKRHRLKLGAANGRLKMDQYKNEYKEGGIQEDNLHKTYFAYLEWEWLFAKRLSLFARAGYRFLESETTTLHNERMETIPGTGREIPVYDREKNTRFYGSGVEFGVGLSVTID
ncbi:hypothetical protein SAMN05443144_104180 [Fodinibius roseus]|uniref:Outer membrane protein beta-barrel domain-containing protein n=1 Tax=Fodinibius roseus TaxID=1194090 RepID=A0A1M4XPN7_9BACT|nr:hypothetical protein [Fodinibius roseus]SHE95381.1 hypothetical protein SAMN05443144_104180 [Fodinibius roseus]